MILIYSYFKGDYMSEVLRGEMTHSFNTARAQPQVMKIMQSENYPRFRQLFQQYDDSTIRSFFIEQGKSILKWAITCMPSAEALAILAENVPKDILLRLLQENNYGIFQNFLAAQSAAETYGRAINRQVRKDKLIILINIDPVGIGNFIDKNKERISATILEDCNEALRGAVLTHNTAKLVYK